VVIVERSRALNARTVQANQLAVAARSSGDALQQSKASVGTLTKRQQALAKTNAAIAKERAALRRQLTSLEAIATKLDACVQGGGAVGAKGTRAVAASDQARIAQCKQVAASFNAYREQFR
jgi:hypothetical protein